MSTPTPDMPEEFYVGLEDPNEIVGAILHIEGCLADLLARWFLVDDAARIEFFKEEFPDVAFGAQSGTNVGVQNSYRRVCWMLTTLNGIDDSI